jgi:ribosomal protein S20
MPNKKSAEKELRKAKKRAIANKKVATKAKTLVKANLKKIADNDKSVKENLPATLLKLLIKPLKKVLSKKILLPAKNLV